MVWVCNDRVYHKVYRFRVVSVFAVLQLPLLRHTNMTVMTNMIMHVSQVWCGVPVEYCHDQLAVFKANSSLC